MLEQLACRFRRIRKPPRDGTVPFCSADERKIGTVPGRFRISPQAFAEPICRNEARNGAVRLLGCAASSAGVPAATIFPPSSPAPGPMSMTQSLPATTRMSCSTTITVLPASTRHVELGDQFLDVGRMQAGGRLVEDVEILAALGALQFGGQLDPLGLAAGKLGGRLTQPQIAQADLAHHVQRPGNRRHVGEKLARPHRRSCPARRRSIARDISLRAFAGCSGAVAGRDTGHKRSAKTTARPSRNLRLRTSGSALGHVERKPAGVVAARAGHLRRGEQLADLVEQARVGRQVRTRRAADRLSDRRGPAA